VLRGDVVGRLPDEISYLAVGAQLPQDRGVDVGADRQTVAGAGQAGPGAGWLARVGVFEDVGELVGHLGQAD
jgi:hypothetical protein